MTVYHVVGFTQWNGTCKMHSTPDCPQLRKRRRDAHFTWGTREGTVPEVVAVSDWDGPKSSLCKVCKPNPNPTEE